MDPFTGLGSTAVACARLGVNFIGADIDETYLDEAARADTGRRPRRLRHAPRHAHGERRPARKARAKA